MHPLSDSPPALELFLGSALAERAERASQAGSSMVVLVADDGEPPRAPGAGVTVCASENDALLHLRRATGPVPVRAELHAAAGRDTARFRERLEACFVARGLERATVAVTGPRFVRHALANLPEVARAPSVAALDGAFQSVPCLLVSPGPSLSKNLPLLAEAKGRSLLVTGTHALAAFDSIGVSPDVVLAADAGNLARHLHGRDLSRVGAVAIGSTCAPETFRAARAAGARRVFTFGANDRVDSWVYEPLQEEGGLPTGGSVACSAFSLALRMGCDPIVFVGQDLSFPGGRYYAAESQDGTSRVVDTGDGRFRLEKPPETGDEYGAGRRSDGTLIFQRESPVAEVPGYHGGRVRTSEAFRAFLSWFECEVERLGGTPRIWNATEGGARIEGARQLTLREALDQLGGAGEPRVEEQLEEAMRTLDPEHRRAALERGLRTTLEGLEGTRSLAARCLRLAQDAALDDWGLERLAVAERSLRASCGFTGCLAVLAQGAIARATQCAAAAKTLEENLAASRELYGALHTLATELSGPVREAVARLESLGRGSAELEQAAERP